MNQPVDGCDGHSLVGEDFAPCTEWLVGSDRKASDFIAPCDKFEENRAFGVVFLGIGKGADMMSPPKPTESQIGPQGNPMIQVIAGTL